MKQEFTPDWPETQKLFREYLKASALGGSWKGLVESLRTAAVRGHKPSQTGNHVDVRLTVNGRARTLHMETRCLSGSKALESVLGALILELVPSVREWLDQTEKQLRAKGKFEFSFQRGVQMASLLHEDCRTGGVKFCDEVESYLGVLDVSASEAKRKHARGAALAEAKTQIKIAVKNGLSPEEIIDFVNECVVEDVLSS